MKKLTKERRRGMTTLVWDEYAGEPVEVERPDGPTLEEVARAKMHRDGWWGDYDDEEA